MSSSARISSCALLTLAAMMADDARAAGTTLNVVVTEPSYSGCDDVAFDWIETSDCDGLSSSPLGGAAFVWVVVSDEASFPSGIGGVQFATTHSMPVGSWTLCTGGNQIPGEGWPASGSGNAVTWASGCYEPPGTNARVGYFAIDDGSSGTFGIEPDPRVGAALWVECGGDSPVPICSAGLGMLDLATGGSPLCGEQAGGLPDAATSCVASDGDCEIEITWEHPGGDLTDFEIDRDGVTVGGAPAGARSYVDAGAVRGVSYTYAIIATNSCGSAPASDPDVGDRASLPAPAGVDASEDLCEGILVSWTHDPASGATGFDVYRNGVLASSVGAETREFLDSAITHGSSATYHVVAVDDCGDSEPSAEVSGTRARVPFAPTQCRATDDRCLAVHVTWADRSLDEIGFAVRRDGVTLATTDPDVEAFTDDTAVPDVEYTYDVVAIGVCGGSASNTNPGMRVSTPPGAATELTATDGLCGVVRLAWQDNSPDETGFRIRRDDELIATTGPDVRSYTDTGATADVPHTYTVVPTNACGEGGPPTEATGTAGSDPPSAAADCSATDTNCAAVIVTWTDTSDDESVFDLVRDGGVIATLGAGTTRYVDDSAEPDVTYTYAVVARNACGSAPPSNDDAGIRPGDVALPAPDLVYPPDGVECIDGAVPFAWTSVEGATHYRIRAGTECGVIDLVDEVTADTTYTRTLTGQTVHWWVAPRNACGTFGDPSACRTFTTAPSLGAPELRDHALDEEGLWYFEWDPAPGAERYVLVLDPQECHYYYDATRHVVAGTDTTLDVSEYSRPPYGIQFYAWLYYEACGTVSDSTECGGPGEGVPVLLESFTATPQGGSVVVEWRTSRERDVLGFRLTRAEAAGGAGGADAGDAVDVTGGLVEPGRSAYRVVDDAVAPDHEYVYRLSERRTDGRDVFLAETRTRTPAARGAVWLSPSRPNPFNPTASMTVHLERGGEVRLGIFDPTGRLVRALLEGRLDAGEHIVTWDGCDDGGTPAASGTYFARLDAGDIHRLRRVVLIR